MYNKSMSHDTLTYLTYFTGMLERVTFLVAINYISENIITKHISETKLSPQ